MFKRFLALILVIITVFSLSACDGMLADGEPEAESDSSESGTPSVDGGESDLSTLAGKTPLEVYRAAEEYISAMTNYQLLMTYTSNVDYNGSKSTSSTESSYIVNDDELHYYYKEGENTLSEHWCTDGVFYQNSSVGKQKMEMTFEEYKKTRGVPTDGGVLVELDDEYFDGVKFDKKDGEYTLSFKITIEDYQEYSGVALAAPAPYVVSFDENANPTGLYMGTTQLVYGMFKVDGEMNMYIKNVGSVEDVTAPAEADEYKTVVKYEEIDFSTIDGLSGVVESETATDYVKIDVKNKGSIVIRLYPDVAPVTVENFKSLVSQKFYDGLIFHRVIENFMIQGGCPKGDGTGGSDKNIVGEFGANGFINNLLHKRGVVSMARSNEPDSASSQFFIMHAEAVSLDNNYAAFGYVVYGMDVVDAIATSDTDVTNDRPIEDVVIESVRFVTVG